MRRSITKKNNCQVQPPSKHSTHTLWMYNQGSTPVKVKGDKEISNGDRKHQPSDRVESGAVRMDGAVEFSDPAGRMDRSPRTPQRPPEPCV